MIMRFDPTRIDRVPPPIRYRPTRPGPSSARQTWHTGAGLDRARDVVRAADTGRQLLADEPARRRLAARIDWGRVHAAFWLLVLAVITALVITGGIR